jgi:pilus assembly protein Flp/PilA
MKNLPAKIVGSIVANKERGATAVEYGIMVALIAAVIITVVTTLGTNLSTLFGGMGTTIGNAPKP